MRGTLWHTRSRTRLLSRCVRLSTALWHRLGGVCMGVCRKRNWSTRRPAETSHTPRQRSSHSGEGSSPLHTVALHHPHGPNTHAQSRIAITGTGPWYARIRIANSGHLTTPLADFGRYAILCNAVQPIRPRLGAPPSQRPSSYSPSQGPLLALSSGWLAALPTRRERGAQLVACAAPHLRGVYLALHLLGLGGRGTADRLGDGDGLACGIDGNTLHDHEDELARRDVLIDLVLDLGPHATGHRVRDEIGNALD